METDFPRSAQDAEEHIRRIRRDKGLGDGPDQVGNNAADLEAALQILSNDLYQTPTHFLLELIQNADDNSYHDEAVPSLSISYSKGWVRVDCNERGFTRKNVEAICRICQSTKAGRSKSAGFVGEKGIGFKAVFKVASSVWISSGYYTFRFDRDAHLGMIAPIWDEFPQSAKMSGTSILLKLDKDCDEDRILQELQSYDERTLLFLRRLRRLAISADPGALSGTKPFKRELSRESRDGESSEAASTMVLMRDGVAKHYFVWRHVAENIPVEPLRQGITSSEVVLAFPHLVDEDGVVRPVIQEQSVYAFLPICDASFPFILQADFLLSANRDDVHVDSPWNKALATAAAAAFRDAVLHLGNLTNTLRYNWIEYIPTSNAKPRFFADLQAEIMVELAGSRVVEACSGRKVQPSSLIRVPRYLCRPDGAPLVRRKGNEQNLLARGYPQIPLETSDNGYRNSKLDELGVRVMGPELFCKEIREGPAYWLRSKSNEWHACLARVLVTMTQPAAAGLTVIPLRNGDWVSSGRGVYFPGGPSTAAIPDGISISVVDAEAAADPDRRLLFVTRGVQDLSESSIRKAITDTHAKSLRDPLPTDVLVSHAEFLFRTRDVEKGDQPMSIWMAAETGPSFLGGRMYVSSDLPGAASRLLPGKLKFIHPAYAALGGADYDSWIHYLQVTLDVSLYPRIHSNLEPTHEDFALIMQDLPPNTWLTVLRDGWDFYKRWLEDGHMPFSPLVCGRLRAYLRGYKVRCVKKEDLVPLKDTYLPLSHLTDECGAVAPFVDIPDPQDPRWIPLLKSLGVGTSANVEFYLGCLNGAKEMEKASIDEIRQIMHKIENALEEGDSKQQLLAREMMDTKKLIHIPAKGGGRGTWVSQSECFWRGPTWLTQSACLEKHYPDLEVLFRRHLLVPNAMTHHFIREARVITQLPAPVMPHLKKTIVGLAIQHRAGHLDNAQIEEIKDLWIWPVTPANAFTWCLTSISRGEPWLIADRENLRAHFQSLVPLLAFESSFVLKIQNLLRALGLEDRLFSKSATSVTETRGGANFDSSLTEKYRARSKYCFRLIPEDQADKAYIREKFGSVNVFVAREIVRYWKATLGLQRISSRRAEGAAFIESDYTGGLRIYVCEGHAKDAFPYELVEQLRNFFNVPEEHRDLLAAAITAPPERVEQLFEARGIAPLLEELSGDENEEGEEEDAAYEPVQFAPEASKAKSSRLGGDSRFSRLLSSTRFAPEFFKGSASGASSTLPSYDAALDRSAKNAMGRPVEPRAFTDGVTLTALQGELSKLEFVQEQDVVLGRPLAGRPVAQPSFFDRFKPKVQRNSEAGEAIVSDILAAVLGTQYDKETMWRAARRGKKSHEKASFTFSDTEGNFSALLMRLDGLSGNAQGYTRLVYHLDVKVVDNGKFVLTQDELDRARDFSIHSQPNPEEQAPSKDVSVLVTISGLGSEPKIRFLTDPWDLFQDGQLLLKSRTTYTASLNLRTKACGASGGEAGFDSIQIRERRDSESDKPPGYGRGDGVEKRARVGGKA